MQQNQSISHSQTLSFLNRRPSVPCEGGSVRGVMWNGRRGGFYERFMFSWFGSDLFGKGSSEVNTHSRYKPATHDVGAC